VADPHTAARFGRAGRQRVLELFTWRAIASQTIELYRRLVGQLHADTTPGADGDVAG
jgi:starch synthase